MLGQPGAHTDSRRGISVLQGRLEEFRLPSILTLLELEHKSGVLHLGDLVSGGTGSAFVRQGRIVQASLEGRDAPANFEAVLAMVAWEHGVFEFHSGEVPHEDAVGTTTTHILLEAARRHDETTRIVRS
ncbi:MAG: DUF4388 domain-containing protein [Planctomycetes bacterium]|nr:DUF4388 domain-containing protein [Planctomycetota bacterium]